MFYVTIDCGTTNSRAYVIDGRGKVYGKATKTVGVKDTATTGSKTRLQEGLKEIIKAAIQEAEIPLEEIKAVFSSGMITSEIGLVEIPHLLAPSGLDDLSKNFTKVSGTNIIDEKIPVYFVRGVKNEINIGSRTAAEVVGELDFMRGEETQVMGILDRSDISLPATILILSSHTKFISINASGLIKGSLTTMSGQVYDAIKNYTFVGKSVGTNQESEEEPSGYFDEKVVDDAINWINKVGIVRSLMFPRFLDVLLDTTWYERHLFFQALIAAEDMLAVGQLDLFDDELPTNYILVGSKERCKLYQHILKKQFPNASMHAIDTIEEIDELSIHGILTIARKAEIIK